MTCTRLGSRQHSRFVDGAVEESEVGRHEVLVVVPQRQFQRDVVCGGQIVLTTLKGWHGGSRNFKPKKLKNPRIAQSTLK